MRPLRTPRILLAVVATVLAVAAVGLAVAAQSNDDTTQHTPADLPPPPFNRWINASTGRFEVPRWDDRELSDDQKAAKPLPVDPRWAPLSECMAAKGFETRANPAQPFGQADLDHLLSVVNAASPDATANKQLGSNARSAPGIAGTFVTCADASLAIPIEDFPQHGWSVPRIPD